MPPELSLNKLIWRKRMSADNGIYILVTKGATGEDSLEYRVAYHRGIDNIQFEPDWPSEQPCLNRSILIAYFGECEVFTDQDKAYEEAKALEAIDMTDEEYGYLDDNYLEDGICGLDYSSVPFPPQEPAITAT